MWEFNGLPLHVLVVHAAVVFGPLAALSALAYVGLPKYRDGGRDLNNYRIDQNLRRKRWGLTFAIVFGVISILGLGLLVFWASWGG